MEIAVGISQFITYILYAILIGHVSMLFMPEDKKPVIRISKKVLLLSVLGIVLFSFVSVFHISYVFKGNMELMKMMIVVIFETVVGKMWLTTFGVAILYWFILVFKGSRKLEAVAVLMFVFAVAYGSHASAEAENSWIGLSIHYIHFLAAMIWVGILVQVSWFINEEKNWERFIHWFHKVALICLGAIALTGVLLMTYITNDLSDYPSIWALSYGQMLLLKHISIIPVLTFAYINGMLNKKSLKPLPWFKAESVFLFFAFFFTGIMSNLTPPHFVRPLQDDSPSWVDWFLGGEVTNSTDIHLGISVPSIIFLTISLIFIELILSSFKKARSKKAVFLAIGFIITTYFGLMFALQM